MLLPIIFTSCSPERRSWDQDYKGWINFLKDEKGLEQSWNIHKHKDEVVQWDGPRTVVPIVMYGSETIDIS